MFSLRHCIRCSIGLALVSGIISGLAQVQVQCQAKFLMQHRFRFSCRHSFGCSIGLGLVSDIVSGVAQFRFSFRHSFRCSIGLGLVLGIVSGAEQVQVQFQTLFFQPKFRFSFRHSLWCSIGLGLVSDLVSFFSPDLGLGSGLVSGVALVQVQFRAQFLVQDWFRFFLGSSLCLVLGIASDIGSGSG